MIPFLKFFHWHNFLRDDMNTYRYKVIFILLIFFNLNGCSESEESAVGKELVVPKTTEKIKAITPETPRRIADLTKIVIALEGYKRDFRQYPVSSASGKAWDGLYTKELTMNLDWIAGVSPKYIEALPRDPRMLRSESHQYLYRSNGAHYKLIAHRPDDCNVVAISYPALIDPARNCWAYGFWTSQAVGW